MKSWKLNRRSFLKALGLGGAAAGTAAVTAPGKALASVLSPKAQDILPAEAFLNPITAETKAYKPPLEALAEQMAPWPKESMVWTIREVDIAHLKTGETFLNCAAGRPGGRKEAFSAMLKKDAEEHELKQQLYDLMLQVDRFGRTTEGSSDVSFDAISTNRRQLGEVGRRHNWFTMRNLRRKVEELNRKTFRWTDEEQADGSLKIVKRRIKDDGKA